MSTSSKNILFGYTAGMLAGISYGMNPLFAKPLLSHGISVPTMLVFRYLIATLMMGLVVLFRREQVKVSWRQMKILILLGILFTGSSILLFDSYNYIPSGLATTLIYLYPVFTALIMVLLREYPTWQVWLSIAATLIGVVLLCLPSGDINMNPLGIAMAVFSSFSYTLYLVIINRSTRLKTVSADIITFYALIVGSIMLLFFKWKEGTPFTQGISTMGDWFDLISLALFPTMVSLLSLAIATKMIGPTKTSVLGVFEPITAIMIGTLFFSEPFTTNIFAGAVICIAAVLFMIISGSRQKEKI